MIITPPNPPKLRFQTITARAQYTRVRPTKSTLSKSQEYARDLQQHIYDNAVTCASGRDFFPESLLSSILQETDFHCLLPGSSKDLVNFIKTKAIRVFLTAFISINVDDIELVKVAESFRENQLTDKNLPIHDITKPGVCVGPECHILRRRARPSGSEEGTVSMRCSHDRALDSFHIEAWGMASFQTFLLKQWAFTVPLFEKGNLQQFKNGLPEGTILPIIEKDPVPQYSHFSNVFRAKLHAAHQQEYPTDAEGGVNIAVKELKPALDKESGFDVETAFWREVNTLAKLSELSDQHLIQPMTAFKWGATYYIIFEWANGGTLRDFWKKHGKAHLELDGIRIKKYLEQLHGLVKALCKLHNTNMQTTTALAQANMNGRPQATTSQALQENSRAILSSPSEGGGNDDKHWRHGDLKPENILVFESSSWVETLKIADFGLAKQHDFATAFREGPTSTRHTTLQYEAPEAVTNKDKPRSRLYDIWSMGCIILESVIWLLYGYKGLDEFYNEGKDLEAHTQQSLYFTTKINKGNSRSVASVSNTATRCITEILANDPECTQPTALRELLELVRDGLLVVAIPGDPKPGDAPCRATAKELHEKVTNIREKAEHDDNYLFTGTNRKGIPLPWSLSSSNKKVPLVEVTQSPSPQAVHYPPSHKIIILDTTWEILEDEIISSRLIETKRFITFGNLSGDTSSLCKRCLTLDFRGLDLIMSENYTFLTSERVFCAFCDLLLHIFDTSDSVYTNNAGHDFPIGFPKLADIASPTYFEILREWLTDCDNNHTGCHLETTETSPFRLPTRLIDVGRNEFPDVHLLETRSCQELSTQHVRYIALSHPWGDKAENSHYYTTRSNISYHQTGIPVNKLPDTVKDAIRVTRALGVRYLWIDSLCIVQGEDGDFNEEAKHMETVFSFAYCVISASSAKGMSSGFLKSRRDRRVVKFDRPGEPPFYICESIDNFQRDVIEGPLNKRGWVLQERALARRTIYFTENQTYWECGEGVRSALLGDPKFPKVATFSSKGGRIRLYELLYKQYSRLQFTRACDRPLAIAGIEQRLIRAFETQGGYGVFTRYFGRGLLWQRDVTLPSQIMRPIQFPKSQQYKVPSWSWMAYEGAISFMHLPFGGIDWEETEVRSPWSPPSPALTSLSHMSNISNSSWHTADVNERTDLTVVARDFSASADTHIIYDRGERPRDRIMKCVIVGRRKLTAEIDADRIHYVLVIAQQQGAELGTGYERIGVGSLPGSAIMLDEVGLAVQVF
ncbi:heterokaryon incompatibility protein-domain-containing protein [Xylaria telfairii]|nr:heterokaryon incompatibility protein-domain-containing protein [Xylaria telfairii]